MIQVCRTKDITQVLKYADDTYLIVLASNIQPRAVELQNAEQWASTDNLKLNRTKTNKIIIVASSRKSLNSPPPNLAEIKRVASLNILGVTINNKLSVCEHVRQIFSLGARVLVIVVADV